MAADSSQPCAVRLSVRTRQSAGVSIAVGGALTGDALLEAGILERMSDEVRTPAGAYSKVCGQPPEDPGAAVCGNAFAQVRVKVVLRGKSGCGKSAFVASACGDGGALYAAARPWGRDADAHAGHCVVGSDLTDKYLTSVGLSVRHCLWPVKVRIYGTAVPWATNC